MVYNEKRMKWQVMIACFDLFNVALEMNVMAIWVYGITVDASLGRHACDLYVVLIVP